MRISDWSSDVCSSDLRDQPVLVRKLERTVDQRARRKAEGDDRQRHRHPRRSDEQQRFAPDPVDREDREQAGEDRERSRQDVDQQRVVLAEAHRLPQHRSVIKDDVDAHKLLRSEEHTSELQSLMRISYAVLCLKKKKHKSKGSTKLQPNTDKIN